jgi:hypothetical protein
MNGQKLGWHFRSGSKQNSDLYRRRLRERGRKLGRPSLGRALSESSRCDVSLLPDRHSDQRRGRDRRPTINRDRVGDWGQVFSDRQAETLERACWRRCGVPRESG